MQINHEIFHNYLIIFLKNDNQSRKFLLVIITSINYKDFLGDFIMSMNVNGALKVDARSLQHLPQNWIRLFWWGPLLLARVTVLVESKQKLHRGRRARLEYLVLGVALTSLSFMASRLAGVLQAAFLCNESRT
jgi:hypothetical protein